MTESIAQLVDGRWRGGDGARVRSVNPTRPDEIVAEGNSATAGDVDDAVAAAAAALRPWSDVPMHSRGAGGV